MKTFALVCLAASAALLVACSTPSRVAEHHGQAQHANRDAMIENPVPTPLSESGLDSRSVEHVLDGYSRGQKAQEHDRDRTITGELD